MSVELRNEGELLDLGRKIASSNGFDLFKKYNELEAAAFIGVHRQTLKEMRLQGKIQYLRIGPRKISYLGLNIAEYLIGSMTWANPQTPPSGSESIGSRKDLANPHGTERGMTPELRPPAAHRLARQSLKKPKKD